MLRLEQEALRRLWLTLQPEQVARAVELLAKAQSIDLCAIGTSGHMSADFAFRLRKFGRRVNVVSDRVDLSYSIQQMDYARNTAFVRSDAARLADVRIKQP